jgi:oxaloacetate decarboxylase gamma subunit
MIIGALKLMLIGMLFVFLFLLLMMLIIQLVSHLFRKHAMEEEQAFFKKQQSFQNTASDKAVPVAAIIGAVTQHINKK